MANELASAVHSRTTGLRVTEEVIADAMRRYEAMPLDGLEGLSYIYA